MNTTHFERLRPVVTKVAKAASTPVRWRWSQMLCFFVAVLSGTALVREYHVPPHRQPGINAPKYVTKRIEDIRVGDIVMAWDERTGESAPKKVTRLYCHETDRVRVLKIRSDGSSQVQEFRTTDEHPFFVKSMGWMKAGELTPGQEVRQFNGQFGLVEISRREHQPKGTLVYNIETEGVHTYFVAQGGARAPPLLVHNCNKPNARTPLAKPSDSVPPVKGGPQPPTKGNGPESTAAPTLVTGNPANPTVTGKPLGSAPPDLNAGPPALPANPQTLGYYVWQHNGQYYYVPLASPTAGQAAGIPLATSNPGQTVGGLNQVNWGHVEVQGAMLSNLNNVPNAFIIVNNTTVPGMCNICKGTTPLILGPNQTIVVITEGAAVPPAVIPPYRVAPITGGN